MASTNKTINYNLSQYTANDKPTYLSDYNSDMNKIDTQMKANNDLAGLAKSEADDLSSRVDGQDVIIATINATLGEHTSDIDSLNTEVSNINTKVGNLTDLNTTDKSNTISAINEVNTKVGNLNDLNTTDKSDIIGAINEVNNKINNKVDLYSTSEVKTDKVWIDGKPIYRKVIITGVLPNRTGKDIATGLTDINVINMYGYAVRPTDNLHITLPYSAANYNVAVNYHETNNSLSIVAQSDMTAYTESYVIMEYTKNSI